jgi:hypothetical protein
MTTVSWDVMSFGLVEILLGVFYCRRLEGIGLNGVNTPEDGSPPYEQTVLTRKWPF